MITSAPPYEDIRPGDRIAWVQNGKTYWRLVVTHDEWVKDHHGSVFTEPNRQPVFVIDPEAVSMGVGWISYNGVAYYESATYSICANCDEPVSDVHYLCGECR